MDISKNTKINTLIIIMIALSVDGFLQGKLTERVLASSFNLNTLVSVIVDYCVCRGSTGVCVDDYFVCCL